MNELKYSIYFYIFNATVRDFDIEGAVDNFIKFVGESGEVVCATIKSEDDTRDRLKKLEEKHPNFKVIESNIDISESNTWDGDLKTVAMKACKNPLLIIADADERFPLSTKPKWDIYATQLMQTPQVDGVLIPVIDLWGDKEKIRVNSNIGQKFRLHKKSVFSRGVPNFAKRSDGMILTDHSDTTEPLNLNGELCQFASIVSEINLHPNFAFGLNKYPYVIHYGFIDLEKKAELGRAFWKKEWEKRSGKEENVATSKEQLDFEPTIKHNLSLE